MDLLNYHSEFIAHLHQQDYTRTPKNLYEPIDYILQLGGKRIRPILTLIGADIFSENFKKALPAALAVEIFHNFTLIHDDIMDEAPLRRGKETVHEKWNLNTGILSGDAMLILAYQYFENYEPVIFQKLAQLFSKTALEVCDGQQLDIDFETRNDVTIDQYLQMITLKTSVLLGAALKMGAIVAKADEAQAQYLYDYGLNLGIAFQLQDDYLDTFGDSKTFGKQIGGDIIENKKTYLYLKTLEVANDADIKDLISFYNGNKKNNKEKIIAVTAIFQRNEIPTLTKQIIEKYTNKAFSCIEKLLINDEAKMGLRQLGLNLMSRNV